MAVKASAMSSVKIEIEEPLAAPGKAAELLGMPRIDFIKHASRLRIAFFDMTDDEWEAEKAALKAS